MLLSGLLVIGATVIAAIQVACAGTRGLTRSSAQRMIEKSDRFKAPVKVGLKDDQEFKIFPEPPDESEQSVRSRVLQIHLSSYPGRSVLRHLGYVEVNISVVRPSQVNTVGGFSTRSPWVLKIEPILTEKGKDLARSQGMEGDHAVPLAHREVVEVTGIREKGGQAAVDFTWKAVPTEAGRAFDPSTDMFKRLPSELQQALTKLRGIGPFSGTGTQDWGRVWEATAGFQKYDDGWRLASISGLQ
jgi:hypothetical protein